MATLDDLKGVLDSIETSMVDQNVALQEMLTSQKEAFEAQKRMNELNSVDRSVSGGAGSSGSGNGGAVATALRGVGESAAGFTKLFAGLGGGLGALLGGLGGGAAGLAALLMVGTFIDGEKVRTNIEEILSIGEGRTLEQFARDGVVIGGLYALGKALVMFGIGGAFNVGVAFFSEQTGTENWATAVKTNVETLLSIGEGKNNAEALQEGSIAIGAIAAVGAGLIAFGVGSGITAAVDLFARDDWAQNTKDNVNTLLSIADNADQSKLDLMAEGGAVMGALGALGIGLGLFAMGEGIDKAVSLFGDENWAEETANNVKTLLSIADDPNFTFGDAAGFVGVMASLMTGLIAFSIGKGVDGVVTPTTETLALFTDPENQGFAERIKHEVTTLLSIMDLPGIGRDVGAFATAMTGIAVGLVAFSLGKGVEGGAEAFQEAIEHFTGEEEYAHRIYDEVEKLLSITDLTDSGKAGDFAAAMSSIGLGLAAFGVGEFVGTLANAGTVIMGFFGAASPFEQIMDIADKSDTLLAGATALEKIVDALNKFGDIQLSNIDLDFKEMARNLGEALPFFDALANGGYVEGSDTWWPGNDGISFPEGGIFNPNLRLNEVAGQINALKRALSMDVGDFTPSTLGASSILNPVAGFQEAQMYNFSDRMIAINEDMLKSLQAIEQNTMRSSGTLFFNNAPVFAPSTSNVTGGTNSNVNIANMASQSDLSYGLPRGPY